MAEIEERKKKWRILYSPLALIVLLIVFIFVARAAWSVYNHSLSSSRDRQRVENELVTTQARLAVLKKQVAVLETSQGVDEEIRSKFNVSKAGEGVAVIVGSAATSNSATVSFVTKNWWQKLLGFFGL